MLPGMETMLLSSAASLPPVTIYDDVVEKAVIDPADAVAFWRLKNDGTVENSSGFGGYDWLNTGNAADFEARASIVSGSLYGGTVGAWQSLAVTRTWTRTRTTIGTSSCVFDLEIRLAAPPFTALGTARITLMAGVEP